MGKKSYRRMACPGPDDSSVFAAFVVPLRSHNKTHMRTTPNMHCVRNAHSALRGKDNTCVI